MKTVIIIQSGLPEYEGNTYISTWGTGEGNTLEEVCRDIIRQHPEKGKDFRCDHKGRCSDWGFELRFLNVQEVAMLVDSSPEVVRNSIERDWAQQREKVAQRIVTEFKWVLILGAIGWGLFILGKIGVL